MKAEKMNASHKIRKSKRKMSDNSLDTDRQKRERRKQRRLKKADRVAV